MTLGGSLPLFVPHSSGRNELAPALVDYFLVGKPRYTHGKQLGNRISAQRCDMGNRCIWRKRGMAAGGLRPYLKGKGAE